MNYPQTNNMVSHCFFRSNITFVLSAVTVRVNTSSTLTLDFDASFLVGVGGKKPIVVLQEKKRFHEKSRKKRFHAYQLKDHSYVKVWSQDLAQHFTTTDTDCHIVVTETGEVLLQEGEDSPTLLMDGDGSRVVDTWLQEGELIGCLPPARPAYARKREDARYEVFVLEDDHRTGSTLPHTWTDDWLSVCGNQKRGIAVTSYNDQTLSIFSTQGNLIIPYDIIHRLMSLLWH